MKNIYELKSDWEMLMNLIEDGEFTEEDLQDTFESLQYDIEVKAENYGLVMKNLEAQVGGLDAEIKRLADRKATINNGIDRMKSNLQEIMIATDNKKFKTEHFSFSTRKSTSVAIQCATAELPDEFVVTKETKSPDKRLIGAKLKAGESIYGCELVEKESIQIK